MAVLKRWRALALYAACFAVIVNRVSGSQDIVKKLTVGFSKAMEQCKIELNIQENVMQDFYNFWREDYALVNREMGCMLMCMASKFDLITDDAKLHHGNAHEFAKKHGADDDLSKQLVGMIHSCEQTHEAVADDCTRVLEMAKCFKTKIHELKWAPSMEVVLEEVMAEMQA